MLQGLILLLAAGAAQAQQPARVPPTPERALQACEASNAAACSVYGTMLLRGSDALPKDPARGLSFLRRGCDGGHVAGCRALATVAQRGQVVPVDLPLARAGFDKACILRDGASCLRLALMMSAGEGGAKDMGGAMVTMVKACAYGEAQACDRSAAAPAPRTAAQRRALTPAEQRACAVQYTGKGDALAGGAMVTNQRKPAEAIELHRRGVAVLGLPAGAALPADIQLDANKVRGAMFRRGAEQEAAIRTNVVTIDNCDRAQGLAAVPRS